MFNKWLKRLKKNERGLTLVELLAVIVILAIVAAIAFILIGNVIENSKKDAHVSNALQLISAAKLYDATEGVDGTGDITLTELQQSGYIGSLVDPWKGEGDDYGKNAKVSKSTTDSGVTYSVTLASQECNIQDETEEQLNSQGREICTSSDSGD